MQSYSCIIFLSLFFISITYCNIYKPDTYYDFCNINDSKAAFIIIKDIQNHFNLEKNQEKGKCLILNDNIKNYYVRFENIEKFNYNVYANFKCTDCSKKFKSRSLLNLHYKLFHLSKVNNVNMKYFCPSDFCRFLNCDRYKFYFSMPFADSPAAGNYQLLEKHEECNPSLVKFYRQGCMKLLEDCLNLEDEKSIDALFNFYNNFCMKIDCARQSKEFDYHKDLQKEAGIWDVLYVISVYVTSILAFIYMLVVWISKYS